MMRFLGGGVGHVDPAQYVPAEMESILEVDEGGADEDGMEIGGEMEPQFEDVVEGPDGDTEGLGGGNEGLGSDSGEVEEAGELEEGEEDHAVGMEEGSGHPEGEEAFEDCGTDNELEGDLKASDDEDDGGSLEGFEYE